MYTETSYIHGNPDLPAVALDNVLVHRHGMQRFAQLSRRPISNRAEQRAIELPLMSSRLQILLNQALRSQPDRNVPHLFSFSCNAELQHAITPLQVFHLQFA